MNGLITDIQRFSLNDGPGIRTTVFFKGCNMNCLWCHNPETLNIKRDLLFYPNKCIGCGHCITACPNGAHTIDIDGRHCIDRKRCVVCGKCAVLCYAEALEICGKKMSVDELMFQIMQDEQYYKNSCGGVTLSGGEATLQKDFALELIRECHKNGIHTAIESNISLPFEAVVELFSNLDLIMCDLKIFDNEAHKRYTGVENEAILNNIKRLDNLNIPVIVRTPLVPGVTDTKENIRAVSEYISDMKNLVRYEILNYNPLGASKYSALSIKNTFRNARSLRSERLEELKKTAQAYISEVKVV